MQEGLKIYSVEFEGVYPVGSCLILAAFNEEQANEIAKNTISHTDKFEVTELNINAPSVILYMSGDY